MDHLIVRFSQGLPSKIERLGEKGFFHIPKGKRLKTLHFMTSQPQHVLKKKKTVWEVIGKAPCMKQRGGNKYNSFLRHVKKVIALVPGHDLKGLPLADLQRHPQIKRLYEQHFKNNPELINYPSVLNAVASNVLNYDASTGLVRDSIADVRQKKQVPPSAIPLAITKENEFDRLLLLALDQFLAQRNIPVVFLKSNYFTTRPQLQQAYQDNPQEVFRSKLEEVRDHLETQIWSDYVTLVNETNRIYLSRYPFEDVAIQLIGLTAATSGFTGLRSKLQTIERVSLAIPGSTAKFRGLEDMMQTYAKTLEAKVVNPDHFMHGVQRIMTNDRDFVLNVVKNNSRSHAKVISILKGNSL